MNTYSAQFEQRNGKIRTVYIKAETEQKALVMFRNAAKQTGDELISTYIEGAANDQKM